VEVRTSEGWLIILDAGTGIRELGRDLLGRSNGAPITGDLFLTHAHWDHIQGIPFFAPIFGRGNHFTIWGSESLERSFAKVLKDQMSPVVFPVSFEELDATIDFKGLPEGTPTAGKGYEVTAFAVQHPGGALGYRFKSEGQRDGGLVYVSDSELSPHSRYDSPPDWRDRMVAFAKGAQVLVHDTTYTTEEYDHHRGWGHSTYAEAVQLALDAKVGTLVLFHHEPRRTDDQLDQQLAQCQQLVKDRGATLQVVAAAEGLTLTL